MIPRLPSAAPTVTLASHVVRCFEDPDVVHVEGSVDPIRDLELIFADLDSLEKRHKRFIKAAKGGDKEAMLHVAQNNWVALLRALLGAGKVIQNKWVALLRASI